MRPEIASLLTPHIYSELENHPSVFDYDNIKVCIILALVLSPFGLFFLLGDICFLACMDKK